MPKYIFVFLIFFTFFLVFPLKVSALGLINNTTNVRGYFDGVQSNGDGVSLYGWTCNIDQPNVSQTVNVYLSNVTGATCVDYNNTQYCKVPGLSTTANIQRSGTSAICGFDKTGYSINIPDSFKDSTVHYALVSVVISGQEHFLEINPGATEWFFLTEPEPEQFDYNNDKKTDLKDLIILLQALFNK